MAIVHICCHSAGGVPSWMPSPPTCNTGCKSSTSLGCAASGDQLTTENGMPLRSCPDKREPPSEPAQYAAASYMNSVSVRSSHREPRTHARTRIARTRSVTRSVVAGGSSLLRYGTCVHGAPTFWSRDCSLDATGHTGRGVNVHAPCRCTAHARLRTRWRRSHSSTDYELASGPVARKRV
jgi:hypothetical protein